MKIKKYITIVFLAALLTPIFGANRKNDTNEIADMSEINFIETETPLDFDTETFLPDGFDAFEEVVPVRSIQFLEVDDVELGFDTEDYLPKGFDPYQK